MWRIEGGGRETERQEMDDEGETRARDMIELVQLGMYIGSVYQASTQYPYCINTQDR